MFSATSSTVADPSKVTVRIESASTSDLNVQDVVTTSSSDEEDVLQQQRKQMHIDRLHNQISSTTNRRHTSALTTTNPIPLQQQHHHHHHHHRRPSRLSTDVISSMRVPQSRPITAVSLPAKPFAYDNEWDVDCVRTVVSPVQRRNPSCPSIPPASGRTKSPSQSMFIHQQVPPVFTTTTECLGTTEFRLQPRRDPPRRSQSLAKPTSSMTTPASPTIPIVFLTDDILLGSIRALQNERQLCKLSVDYLIDATNMRPDEVARKANVGTRLPCHCGHRHSRCTLTLEFNQPFLSSNSTSNLPSHEHTSNSGKLRQLDRLQLDQLFGAVNRFIAKAQQEGKRVLIYGFELTTNSPLAVIAIQYMMLTDEQLSLAEATNRIQRLFPIIPLQHQQYPIMEARFQDYLKQLERKIFPRNFLASTISGDGSSSGNETRQSPRELSWESSETTTYSTPVTSWTTIPMPVVHNRTNSSHHLFSARSAWDT